MLIKKITINVEKNFLVEDTKYFATQIKSEMRFWFRILNSTYLELKEVYKQESKLFGDSSNTKSPIKIIVKKEKNINNKEELNLYFILQTKFKVINESFMEHKSNDEKLDWYINLFNVSFILGNIGKGRKKFDTANIIKLHYQTKQFSKDEIKKLINEVVINNKNDINFSNIDILPYFSKEKIKNYKNDYTMLQIWIFEKSDTKYKPKYVESEVKKIKKKKSFNANKEEIIMTRLDSFDLITYINIK